MAMKSKGFTLIELMMTVAILAIIIAVAVPAYNNQIQKTRRADAQSGLLDAAQALERCFTRNNTYVECDVRNVSPDGFYHINANLQVTGYLLSADPGGENASGQQDGDPCGTFTLDHRGNKSAGSETDRCWGS